MIQNLSILSGLSDWLRFISHRTLHNHHFKNKSDTKLFTAENLEEQFYFMIDLNRSFDFLFVFLSDNYDNILDWFQLVATSYNVDGNYDIAFKKEVEIKLEDP